MNDKELYEFNLWYHEYCRSSLDGLTADRKSSLSAWIARSKIPDRNLEEGENEEQIGYVKEPWYFVLFPEYRWLHIRAAYGGHRILLSSFYKQRGDGENVRRIVACVNACAGVETETLEKYSFSKHQGLKEFHDVSLESLILSMNYDNK